MNKNLGLGLCAVVLSLLSGATLAQDSDYHPALSDNFTASLGWFRSDNTFNISKERNTDLPNDEIDFGKSLGVDQTNTLFNAQLRWKFGSKRKWSLSGQYFKNKASGDAVLKEDVEWGNIVFREGTSVDAGVSVQVTRLAIGRSFFKNDQHEFGVGIGLHILDLGAHIEGEILINDESTEFYRGDADASAPLPNLATWYQFSPSKKWLLRSRVDWISANIGDYNGSMWNINAGVNYQFSRHFGLDLSYQYFNLNLDIDKSDWSGGVDMTYRGPVISLTSNW